MRMIKLDNSKSASRMPPASLDMYRHSNTQVYCFNTVSKRYKYVSKPYTYAYDRLQHSASKKSWQPNKLHGHHFYEHRGHRLYSPNPAIFHSLLYFTACYIS